MSKWLYIVGIHLFKIFYENILAHFNPKAKLATQGRKNQKNKLEELGKKQSPKLWMHCASLGEFEQGLPLLQQIKKEHPNWEIVLTFFSPSGYEKRKNNPIIDHCFYLPFDTKQEVIKFVQFVNPKVFILIKYEFWFNILNELEKQKVPSFLVSGVFRKNQIFFKPWGKWFKKRLIAFNQLFVQNQESKLLLEKHQIMNSTFSGDTRIQRVINQLNEDNKLSYIEDFKSSKKLFVAGSTWPAEHKELIKLANESNQDWKFVIAPHEMHEKELAELQKNMNDSIRFSELNEGTNLTNKKVLILDAIGYLSRVYSYANLAYVGGAFGSGLHNVLEAIVFGVPVAFGNKTNKFPEAEALLKAEAAMQLESLVSFVPSLQELIQNMDKLNVMSMNAKTFITNQPDAVSVVYKVIKPILEEI